MLKNLTLVLIVFIAGCSFPKMPQSTTEFIKMTASTDGLILTKTIINKPFSYASSKLKKNINNCFNYDSKWSRSQGGMTAGSFTQRYRARVTKKSTNYLEMALQSEPMGNRIGPKMPKGGFYMVVVRISKINNKKSLLKVYSSEWNAAKKEMVSWANGKKAKCPN